MQWWGSNNLGGRLLLLLLCRLPLAPLGSPARGCFGAVCMRFLAGSPHWACGARQRGKHYQSGSTDWSLCELQLSRAYERTSLQACGGDYWSNPRGQDEEEEKRVCECAQSTLACLNSTKTKLNTSTLDQQKSKPEGPRSSV